MTRTPTLSGLAAVAFAAVASAQTPWVAVTASPSPPARSWPALAYDSARGRTVLFGGGAGGTWFNDTWELDGSGWTQVTTAQAPAARSGHALAYDSGRGRVVLFGGETGFGPGSEVGDTWEFDGSQWTQVQVAVAPAARLDHALAYDSARRRTVLFGGHALGAFADTWEFDGSQWALIATASPQGRYAHALAYDAARGAAVLFGGITWGGQVLNDTWMYDGTRWTPVLPALAPSTRYFHKLAYDSARGMTVLFGGFLANTLADTWLFDGVTWAPVAAVTAPPARWHHALAYDSERGRTVLFGGTSLANYLGDTWELLPPATATWARLGTGCSGSAGVPGLDVVGAALPQLNSSFPLQFTALPAQPGLLGLALGFGTAQWNGRALPLDLGAAGLPACPLWIAPATVVGVTHPGGSTTWQLRIPGDPALDGLRVALQA